MDDSSENDENSMLDSSSSTPSLLLPTINDKNFVNNIDFKEDFLRLTSMVRRVYLSYLHKSLLSNYANSCPTKNTEDFDSRIKDCASQMELFAVQSALETSLYRKAMTNLISEVKEHTKEQKLHKIFTSFLVSPPGKSDMAVQTDQVETFKIEDANTLQIATSNSTHSIELQNNLSENSLDPTVTIKMELTSDDSKFGTEPPSSDSKSSVQLTPNNLKNGTKTLIDDLNHAIGPSSIDLNVATQDRTQKTPSKDFILNLNPDSSFQFQNSNETQLLEKNEQSSLNESSKFKGEDSQDSLFQTMEDMFCESDDSSDLMTLIEKHSSTQSENLTSKTTPKTPEVINTFKNKLEPRRNKRKRTSKTDSVESKTDSVESKKKSLRNSPIGFNELKSPKYRKKVNEIWLVERVYQTSKLKSKMLEISLSDYRKYGRIKDKFVELFGESDDEDAMPESPICIEEHLRACKERIAPWIVKHLTPFFNQKRISSRELFKTICRHITDMLIIDNTFPEESAVENYMREFFKNKKSIKTEADIYL